MPGLRETLTRLADLIEEHYVFPERACRIARELRAWPAPAGPPAAASAPAEWTAEVKRFLRGHDAHLNLTWLPGRAVDRCPSRPDITDPGHLRRTNYGFRQAGIAEEGIGLLDLTLLPDTDHPPALAAAVAATGMVAHAETVVLDLRGVPGGWPSGGNLLAGHFLPPGPVHLLTMTRRGGEAEQFDRTPVDNPLGHRPDVPLFVLVDAGTASAAEAFAYTAQSLGRAVVVGQRTAGAANPGDFFPIGEEFTAFVPTMAPVDPRTGTNWEGTGVSPDVVTDPGATVDEALALARSALRTG